MDLAIVLTSDSLEGLSLSAYVWVYLCDEVMHVQSMALFQPVKQADFPVKLASLHVPTAKVASHIYYFVDEYDNQPNLMRQFSGSLTVVNYQL